MLHPKSPAKAADSGNPNEDASHSRQVTVDPTKADTVRLLFAIIHRVTMARFLLGAASKRFVSTLHWDGPSDGTRTSFHLPIEFIESR